MTRWQADDDGTMRLFRLYEVRLSDEASARIRRRVMRRARLERWRYRLTQAWKTATINAWDIVLGIAALLALWAMG